MDAAHNDGYASGAERLVGGLLPKAAAGARCAVAKPTSHRRPQERRGRLLPCAACAYVEADPRWGSRGRVRWAHAVVLPFTAVPDDFAVPEYPRRQDRWSR